MKNLGEKKILIAGIVVAVLIVGGAIFITQTSTGPKIEKPSILEPRVQEEPAEEIPTLTPERIEIISKLETHIVTIQNNTLNPNTLTIKLHDQVEWQNKGSEDYQIKGEDWGNVPIAPGESFTQAFETAGTFSYSCALHPELTGTIIVQ